MTARLVITAGNLLKAARIAAMVVEKRNTIPVLSCLHIDGNRITGTNLDIEITVEMIAAEESLCAAVDAGQLCRLCAAIPSDTVLTISAQESSGLLSLAFPGAVYSLHKANPADFPFMPRPDKSVALRTSNLGIAAAFRLVAPAISTEETRYYLNGLCLAKWKNGTPCVVATDGHRMFVRDVPGAEGFESQIVPRKAVECVLAVGDPVAMLIAETHVEFEFPGITIMTKLIDGSYPDFERVVPKVEALTKKLVLPVAEMRAAIRRIYAVDESRSKALVVRSCKKGLFIASDSAGFNATERLDFDNLAHGDDDVMVGLNSRYVREAMASDPDQGETIEFGVSDPAAPLAYRREGFVGVLMPLRISAELTDVAIELYEGAVEAAQ